jgi:nucleoid DNA-binding protein
MKNKGTRTELARELWESTGFPIAEMNFSVNVFVNWIVGTLGEGKGIELRGLGSFEVKKTAPRRVAMGGQESTVPAHGRVVFKPCEKLRKAVWGFRE